RLPRRRSVLGGKRAGVAELPVAAMQRVEQRHLVLAGMGDDGGEALAGAARARLAGRRHLLLLGTVGRRRRHAGERAQLLVARGEVIILRLAALDHALQLEMAEARGVDPGLLLAVVLPRWQRPEENLGAGGRPLLGGER